MQCDLIAIDVRVGLDAGFDSATGFDMVLPSALVLTVILNLLGVGLMCSDAPPSDESQFWLLSCRDRRVGTALR